MATESHDGQKSGVTSGWERFLTPPASASVRPTSIARRSRPTTTRKAPWMKPGDICRRLTSHRRAVGRTDHSSLYIVAAQADHRVQNHAARIGLPLARKRKVKVKCPTCKQP